MHTEISIPFNERLSTREKIRAMTLVVHGLTINGFKVKVFLKGTPNDYLLTPEEGFEPTALIFFIEELIARVGALRGIVELLEKR